MAGIHRGCGLPHANPVDVRRLGQGAGGAMDRSPALARHWRRMAADGPGGIDAARSRRAGASRQLVRGRRLRTLEGGTAAARSRGGSGQRQPRHAGDGRSRLAVDGKRLQCLSGISTAARRGRRVQRQVHDQPDGAARRLGRNASRTHASDLSEFLSPGSALAVLRPSIGAGCLGKDQSMADAATTPPVDQTVLAEALAGLSQACKTLPPKLFYDEEGCRLFRLITELPEYYLTRTERGLLETAAPSVAAAMLPGALLVEYGARDEDKAE